MGNTFAKTDQTVRLGSVHFTSCKLYLNFERCFRDG